VGAKAEATAGWYQLQVQNFIKMSETLGWNRADFVLTPTHFVGAGIFLFPAAAQIRERMKSYAYPI